MNFLGNPFIFLLIKAASEEILIKSLQYFSNESTKEFLNKPINGFQFQILDNFLDIRIFKAWHARFSKRIPSGTPKWISRWFQRIHERIPGEVFRKHVREITVAVDEFLKTFGFSFWKNLRKFFQNFRKKKKILKESLEKFVKEYFLKIYNIFWRWNSNLVVSFLQNFWSNIRKKSQHHK